MSQLFVDEQTRYDTDERNEVKTRQYFIEALYAPEMCMARLRVRESRSGLEEFGGGVNVTTQVAAVRMMLAAYDRWLDNLDGYATFEGANEAARVLRVRDEARALEVVA